MALFIFIVNPIAGNGKGRKVWRTVKKDCETAGVDYRTFFTERQGHAKDIAKQVISLYHKKVQAIIAVGGDGTLHEVFNGCSGRPDVPVGIIPAGSGNDFARAFSIPASSRRAFKRLQNRSFKPTRKIDCGRITFTGKEREIFMVNSAGAGFDAAVAKASNQSSFKKILNRVGLGNVAYSLIVMRLLFNYQPSTVSITVDGKTRVFRKVWLSAVSNIPYYGGGMKISPDAKTDDGLFDVCVVHEMSRLKLMSLFVTVFFGSHVRLRGVTMLKGSRIQIQGDQPLPVHIDGETAESTPFAVENKHRSRVIL